jgi:integrase
VLTPARLEAWLRAMSYHTRLAVAIAALAPKLRLRNVLALERGDIDAGVTRLTVYAHKSDVITGEPLVVPISQQLRVILLHAFDHMRPDSTHVVQYRGAAIDSIRGSLKAAAREANIPYGRFAAGGVTFHTLRHTAATLFARLGVSPWLQRDAMGHQDVATTEGYTHLAIEEQRPALEQLSAALPIAAAVMEPHKRARRTKKDRGGEQGSGPIGVTENPRNSLMLTRGATMIPGRQFRRKA